MTKSALIDKFLEEVADAKNLPAKEIMTQNIYSASADITIIEAIEVLKTHRISGLPIVKEETKLAGLVTEHDLLIQAASKSLDSPVEFIEKVYTCGPDTPLKELLIYLFKYRFKRIPVVTEDNTLIGIVSRIDILNKLVDFKK